MSSTPTGFLVIADITGYTTYLNDAELDHAQGVLESLLGLLVDGARSPLVVSNLAGDAVFSYALDSSGVDGQTVVEIVEDTYIAFRRAVDLMVLNTTCACNACVNISSLDLKLFVHHGSFTTHRVGGREELLGPDVITVHRLLKNDVREQTGITAYTLFTDKAVERLGLPGFADGLASYSQPIEGQAPITVFVRDMHPVWAHRADAVRITIPDKDVLVSESIWIPAPPAVVWDYLIRPEYRARFLDVDRQEVEVRNDGRVGEGSVYRCYHGKGKATTQTVLDWHPLQQMATEDTTPIPRTTVVILFALEPTMDEGRPGTTLTVTSRRARGPWPARTLCNIGGRWVLRTSFRNGLRYFRDTAIEEVAAQLRTIPERAVFTAEAVARAAAAELGRAETG